MTFHPYGDSAILINFEQKIDIRTNAKVTDLAKAIEAKQIKGITFYIPAYCSLTIGFDRNQITFEELCQQIKKLAQNNKKQSNPIKSQLLNIPVCYEAPYALDFLDVMEQTGLSKKEIIDLHCGIRFRVYMLGFLPGFAYMGRLPDVLFCHRKTNPRLRVPALSVGLAGFQTGIYPCEAPGGWQIIGRTPISVFDGKKERAFLFQVGDEVQFYSISRQAFEKRMV